MKKHVDAEALLNNLPDDLPYKASVKRVLMQAPSADVAPMEEVNRLKHILDCYAIQYGTVKDMDVVEVVRCWSCKHSEKVENPRHIWSCFCKRFRKTMEVDAEDFCSYGERRTD